MMAGTPVGLVEEAEIGSRAFINAETGAFLREGEHFAEDLRELLERSVSMSPREWAVENIPHAEAIETIEGILGTGAGVTEDICCRGTLTYLGEVEEGVRKAYEELTRDFGLEFGLFPHESAALLKEAD